MNIEFLTPEQKLLQKIGVCIEKYFKTHPDKKEAHLTDIYEFLSRQPALRNVISSPVQFSRFMRRHQGTDAFRKFIGKCYVDTSNRTKYQWRFFAPYKEREKLSPARPITSATSRTGKKLNWHEGRIYDTDAGVKVRSTHEQRIMNLLYAESVLKVEYEQPLRVAGKSIRPDFTVTHIKSGEIYYWEHLGMTDVTSYQKKMDDKIKLYGEGGYRPFKEGGNLILTVYTDDFMEQIENIIERIKKRNQPVL